jgi:thiamine-monophosphate kinase
MGGQVGDWIYVTGRLGNSLQKGHHFRFAPRLQEGAWLARRPEVRAMMDVSDGLAKDLHALTPRGAVPAIDADALPRRPGADVRAALTDGEDYELLFAVAARTDRTAFGQAWTRRFPRTRLTCIGNFCRPTAVPPTAVKLAGYHGYEHLR